MWRHNRWNKEGQQPQRLKQRARNYTTLQRTTENLQDYTIDLVIQHVIEETRRTTLSDGKDTLQPMTWASRRNISQNTSSPVTDIRGSGKTGPNDGSTTSLSNWQKHEKEKERENKRKVNPMCFWKTYDPPPESGGALGNGGAHYRASGTSSQIL